MNYQKKTEKSLDKVSKKLLKLEKMQGKKYCVDRASEINFLKVKKNQIENRGKFNKKIKANEFKIPRKN